MAIDQQRLQNDQSYRADLRNQGYFVGSDSGGNVYAESGHPGGQAGSGGGGGGGGSSSAPGQAAPAVSSGDQAILNAFQNSSGFSLQDLAEKKRQFDLNLDWTKQMWQQQGMPQLEIQQRAQTLAEQEFQAQNALAQQNLALQQRQEGFSENLQSGQLGEQYLKDAASLQGPADYFQEDDFLRGANQRGDVPVFLQALRNNTQLGGGAVAGTPTPQTADNLAARMDGSAASGTGAATGTGTNTSAALNAVGDILKRGGGALAPQGLEQLNPDEMNLLQSGADKLGYSMPAFLQQYAQSRVGQQSAQAA